MSFSEASPDFHQWTIGPDDTRAVIKRALDAGINVLCEKPMALSVEDGRPMIAAAKRSGKLLQIGHCIREARSSVRSE